MSLYYWVRALSVNKRWGILYLVMIWMAECHDSGIFILKRSLHIIRMNSALMKRFPDSIIIAASTIIFWCGIFWNFDDRVKHQFHNLKARSLGCDSSALSILTQAFLFLHSWIVVKYFVSYSYRQTHLNEIFSFNHCKIRLRIYMVCNKNIKVKATFLVCKAWIDKQAFNYWKRLLGAYEMRLMIWSIGLDISFEEETLSYWPWFSHCVSKRTKILLIL